MFQKIFRSILTAGMLAGLGLAGAAHGAAPAESLTIVVPYPPGGASDRAARIVADGLQKKHGTSVIVENRTGAGGRIAAQYMKGVEASKNVVILANPAIMVVAPMVFGDVGYDPARDFQPVSMVTQYGFGVAVSADSALEDMKQLIAWARENPGKFNVGVPATGSLPHFFGLMLAQQIGVNAEIVGYRGSAPLITDLIGGTVPMAIDTLDILTTQHKGKRLRILATSGAEREAGLADVPTFTQAGVKLEASGWNAFFAPASMPQDKAGQWGEAIKSVVADADVQKTLLQNELIPVVANAAETRERVDGFKAQWEPVVKASGFKVTQ